MRAVGSKMSRSSHAIEKKQKTTKKDQKWRENSTEDEEEEDVDVEDHSDESSSNESKTELDNSKTSKVTRGQRNVAKSSSNKSKTKQDISEIVKETTREGIVLKRETQPKDLQDKSRKAGSEISTKTSDENSALYKIMQTVIALIVLVVLIVYSLDYIPEEIKPNFLYPPRADDKFNYPMIFTDRLEKVRQLFPNQTERFWRIIKARGLAHLRNRKPSQPLVFMMGAPPAAHSAVDCIAKKISWALDPEMNSSYFIDGIKYSESEGDRTKKVLDDKLEEIFQRGERSALIMHLERLPPPSPLLFYKYCDNDEAPFKHAGIIFTVHLPYEPDTALTSAEAEGTVETYLAQDAWSKYPYESDSIAALLSRIADTVVLANGETDDVIQTACNN